MLCFRDVAFGKGAVLQVASIQIRQQPQRRWRRSGRPGKAAVWGPAAARPVGLSDLRRLRRVVAWRRHSPFCRAHIAHVTGFATATRPGRGKLGRRLPLPAEGRAAAGGGQNSGAGVCWADQKHYTADVGGTGQAGGGEAGGGRCDSQQCGSRAKE